MIDTPTTGSGQRGFGLLDALIALAILAFGMLAMSRFQSRTVAGTTEATTRMVAAGLGDELVSTLLVDPSNSACYTKPAAGVCGSTAAKARLDDWAARTAAALPGTVTTGAVLAVDGRYTVTITWTGKESQTTRTLEAVTDARI